MQSQWIVYNLVHLVFQKQFSHLPYSVPWCWLAVFAVQNNWYLSMFLSFMYLLSRGWFPLLWKIGWLIQKTLSPFKVSTKFFSWCYMKEFLAALQLFILEHLWSGLSFSPMRSWEYIKFAEKVTKWKGELTKWDKQNRDYISSG